MPIDLNQECSRLKEASVAALRQRYAEVFGEPSPHTGNKTWLIRRILWRLQALAEGDLTERAKRQAERLANDADLRLSPPRSAKTTNSPVLVGPRDPRLPRSGSVITRRYKGQLHQVQVLASGFAYQETTYSSLSAVAKAITGSHGNGFLFFRLNSKEKPHAQGG